VTLYIEGGGSTDSEKARLREAFVKFLGPLGLAKRPKIVACGARTEAYETFKLHDDESFAVLLVDSEVEVNETSPWQHVLACRGDKWARPAGATDDQLQLMAVMTETWILADQANLRKYFGKDFDATKLPSSSLESRAKSQIESDLARATTLTKKGKFSKSDVFALLATTATDLVSELCPIWGGRFLALLKAKC
jgi:hypothetical protein